MAQPIQYTPQFIQTDVGAIQNKLNARQGQYDAAYAGALGAEDQFGQFDVHQRDIDLKNKVIGGFKDRVKSIVDQYGGDYASASKQLVKEIVNTKNDKFFKLASERNKLAEEQRRLVQQYGPNAIVLKDVTKPDLIDAQGNYIRPEDLSSEVLNREHFEKILDTDFGLLKNKKREGALTKSGTPGYLQSTTTQGITVAEVNQVAQDMYNTLKKTRPDLPDDIAINIANNQAKSYILGSTNQLVSDKEWDLAQQRAEYDRTHPQTLPGDLNGLPMSSQSYFDVTDEATKIKGLKSKLLDKNGLPLVSAFGKEGNINPLKLYDDVNTYKKDNINIKNKEIKSLYDRYGLDPSIKLEKLDNGQFVIKGNLKGELLKDYQQLQQQQRATDAKYNGIKTISSDEYKYLKDIGVTNNETYKTIIPKINKYESNTAARYNRYDMGITDYQYVTDQLMRQMPSDNSAVKNIIQPLDKNLKPISGAGSLSGRTWSPDSFKFTKDFIDSKGTTKIKSIEFVPSVGLVATNTDGKLFKLGKGAIKDQLNFITDDTGDREVIEYYIKNGDYENANKAINMSISNAVPMMTNSQVAPNPIKLKNNQ